MRIFPPARRSPPPEILDAGRRWFGIADGVLNIDVSQIGLRRPCVVAPCWPRRSRRLVAAYAGCLELAVVAACSTIPREPGGGNRRAAPGGEHERRFRLLFALQTPQRSGIVAQDRMRAGSPACAYGRAGRP